MRICACLTVGALRSLALALTLSIPTLHVACAGEIVKSAGSDDLEALLVKSLMSINDNKLDVALNEVNSLLKINPKFKLAQLVKGDLLLARAKPISDFGNIPGVPREQMEDLRDEARARLQRSQKQKSTRAPKFLWQLDAKQRYAIVVDTGKSTLYLYENINGAPRYVADYYISIGKLGTDKLAEGDQKTPLGVYFVSDNLPKKSLTDFYGSGAYPISYPNEWDRKHGRNGYGIWLHGTPSNTFSRPPRSSNGCVVMSNEDLVKIGKIVQVGVTPVIITDGLDWSAEPDQTERALLIQAIEEWRSDWANINTEAYLKHYAQDFSSGSNNFSTWSQQKRLVNSSKSWIKVSLSGISAIAYPNEANLVVVSFEQNYASNNLSDRMKKRQYWIKRDNRWQIIYEGSA